jgi:hypothetical protein
MNADMINRGTEDPPPTPPTALSLFFFLGGGGTNVPSARPVDPPLITLVCSFRVVGPLFR